MSKRILVIVGRSGSGNLTDKTPTVVYEHEVPILGEIHGIEPEVVEDYEILLDRSVKVTTLKDGTKIDRATLLASMVRDLGLGEAFSTDPMEEYSRLERVYGMHEEIRQPLVTVLYGRFEEGRFTKALGVDALEEMTIQALRKKASDLGIDFSPTDKRVDLIEFIRASVNEASIAGELRKRHDRMAA